jgi:hypothetical protein
LQETEDGTLLTLEHSNVPDEHKSYEEGGWQSNYFEPMIVYFQRAEGRRSRRAGTGGGAARQRADACGNKGSERPPQSERRQAADDHVERTEGEIRGSSEEAEGGRTRDKSCQESFDRRSQKSCEKNPRQKPPAKTQQDAALRKKPPVQAGRARASRRAASGGSSQSPHKEKGANRVGLKRLAPRRSR